MLVLAALVLVGGGLLLSGARELVRVAALRRDGVRCEGTVVGFRQGGGRNGGRYPIVQFTDDGAFGRFNLHFVLGLGTTPRRGARVPVRYDAGDPNDAIVDTRLLAYGLPVGCMLFGLLAFAPFAVLVL